MPANNALVKVSLGILLPMLWCAPARPAAAPGADVLDEVVVTGEQPGPAMWKVSKDGHTMWIMGTVAPVPAKITWRSKQVESVIERSGEILGHTGVRAGANIGVFGALRLIPAALRARNNPDGATLREALPADVYARFSAQYRHFYGKEPDPGDKFRPLFAADRLYHQALKKSGLAEQSPVWPTVEKLAKQHKVRIRERQFDVQLQDPKGLIADLADIPRDQEVACLTSTLDYIDRELPDIKRRAAAWAVGDVATLRALTTTVDRTDCLNALLDAVRPKLDTQIKQVTSEVSADRTGIFAWMLLTYDTSFTVMPIDGLLGEDGAIKRWRAAGYTVEEPQ
jgi:uncharacterized protein YbaP (TraB family)